MTGSQTPGGAPGTEPTGDAPKPDQPPQGAADAVQTTTSASSQVPSQPLGKALRRRRRRDVADAAPAKTDPARRMADLAKPRSDTDRMVAQLADQLCAIVRDDYDITVSVAGAGENLQIEKLTLLINSLLENARRSLRSLSDLAADLERKVQERTLRLNLVVQGSNDGVWIWDMRSDAAEFSPRWKQLLGLEAEALGTIDDWLTRVHPDDLPRLRSALRAHMQGATPQLTEDYRIRHADGTWRWMWCRGKCHRDDTGRSVLMAGTQTDIHRVRSVDPETGLPNEAALLSQIGVMLDQGVPFHALILGLPRVFATKEDLGTAAQKELRAAVAQRISDALPLGAELGRLTGEFYAALLPGDRPGASPEAVAARLGSAFGAPFRTGERSVWLDLHIGATRCIAGGDMSPSDVMRDAWTSYRYARSGERRLNILSDRQAADARARAEMELEVRAALEHGWFVPHFQPIVDLQTGLVRGFETLARLDHPRLGLISPGRFIPVAEGIGVMGDVSYVMLNRALDVLSQWHRDSGRDPVPFLSVNLEAAQLMQDGFAEWLSDQLIARQIDPHSLKIEIVESSVISNFALTAGRIADLRALGVRIALDDFGTGYSSLEYLNELEFDLVKIDRTFVTEIATDPKKKSMLRMMCGLANLLQAEICVEGVETPQQAVIAREFGVGLAQGFLYARPMPLSDLDGLMAQLCPVQPRARGA